MKAIKKRIKNWDTWFFVGLLFLGIALGYSIGEWLIVACLGVAALALILASLLRD